MENQDFNKELLDYLYNEMTEGEKAAFEKRLAEEPALMSEYKALKGIRDQLGQLSDKEVVEPISVWESSDKKKRPVSKQINLRPLISIAATLLIIMVLGYLTDFSISANKEGFYLGFNKTNVKTEDKLSREEIQTLLSEAIEKNNKQILAVVGASDSAFQNKFAALEQTVSKVEKNNTDKVDARVLQAFLVDLEEQNAEVVKGYLKLSATQQQEYFKTVLTQFNEFMQEQRSEDLAMIQNNLIELKQTQSFQKKETDQVLAGLISTINYKSKN
jgi:hypothetical protein